MCGDVGKAIVLFLTAESLLSVFLEGILSPYVYMFISCAHRFNNIFLVESELMRYCGKTLKVAAFKNIHNVQSGTLTTAIISTQKTVSGCLASKSTLLESTKSSVKSGPIWLPTAF